MLVVDAIKPNSTYHQVNLRRSCKLSHHRYFHLTAHPIVRVWALENLVEPLRKKGPEIVDRSVIPDLLDEVNCPMEVGLHCSFAVSLVRVRVSNSIDKKISYLFEIEKILPQECFGPWKKVEFDWAPTKDLQGSWESQQVCWLIALHADLGWLRGLRLSIVLVAVTVINGSLRQEIYYFSVIVQWLCLVVQLYFSNEVAYL